MKTLVTPKEEQTVRVWVTHGLAFHYMCFLNFLGTYMK